MEAKATMVEKCRDTVPLSQVLWLLVLAATGGTFSYGSTHFFSLGCGKGGEGQKLS